MSLPLLLALSAAHAATLRVGPAQPYTTVFGAVQAAASGDLILIDPGTYTVNRSILVDKSLTIRGDGGVPQLDAQDLAIFHVTSGTVVLRDMLLAPRGSTGVWIEGGDVTLNTVTVSGNRSGNNTEGAAMLIDSATSVTITGSTFSDNRANGGGILATDHGGCIVGRRATITIRDSLFTACNSQYGGAIWTSDTASLVIEDSTFTNNAADGAGAYGGAIRAEGPLVVRRSLFDHNTSTGTILTTGKAGAIGAPFDAVIEDCVFTQNSSYDGGAIRLATTGGATLTRNLFCANTAGSGGGAISVSSSTAGWTLTNNLFVENEASYGAAIDVPDDGSGVWPTGGVLRNNDFLGNDAGAGDAAIALASARATFENNLLFSNPFIGVDDGSGPLNYNAWFQNGTDLSGRAYGGADLRNTDPLLVSWSRDGDCANDDFSPAAGSPLRNAGNPAILDPDGSRSDIGAWGGPDAPVTVDADADGFALGADCDDTNNAIFPGAAELCNGADDDCDGTVDSPVPAGAPVWHPDVDGDGHGKRGGAVSACDAPAGYVASDDDCDDRHADAYPGAVEACDGYDNDCDDLVDSADEGDLPLWYPDNDGDGFGRPIADPQQGCEAPAGTVANGDDCDDGSAARNPGALEVCDGVDQDCDGVVDDDPEVGLTFYVDADGDGWGDNSGTAVGCQVPDGYAAAQGDCDDADRDVHPLAAEPCAPPRDMNCDGASGSDDNDDDGFGACDECDDFDSSRYPGAPDTWYDGVVQDCDHDSDFDADGDGWDAPQGGGADCDDDDRAVNPTAIDLPGDGVDSNCDGEDTASTGGPGGGPGGTDTDTTDTGDDRGEGDDFACGGCDNGGANSTWALLGAFAVLRRRRA